MRTVDFDGMIAAIGVDDLDKAMSRISESGIWDSTETEMVALREEFAQPGGLIKFTRYFWEVLEPNTELVEGWPLDAICEHLEAVSWGHITRLLINVPPGYMKSLMTEVFWPAWEWGALARPWTRYVTFSYSPKLTERDNARMVRLINSASYRRMYGEVFALTREGEAKIENGETGFKVASSINGATTGFRGHRVMLDDPHNVIKAESEGERLKTVRWIREAMMNRLNDAKTSAIIIIMQRVHEDDASGAVLAAELDYCHLMIPMEFEPSIFPVGPDGMIQYSGNEIGWIDPRALDDDGEMITDPAVLAEREGEIAWAERWDQDDVEKLKITHGPYAYASQYQQSPTPRKGAIFQRDWWQLWDPPNGKFPNSLQFIIASLDSAFTEDEENDPSAMTVWGVFIDEDEDRANLEARLKRGESLDRNDGAIKVLGSKVLLMHAWRKHLMIHGEDVARKIGETDAAYIKRAQPKWGLVEWVAHTCRRFQVDRLLIEAKASGLDVINEMRRLYGGEQWMVEGAKAPQDTVSRALAVQPTFAQGVVYAPPRDWAEMVIDEAARFPKGKYKDLTDSTVHAIRWLRNHGLISRPEEISRLYEARASYGTVKASKQRPIYPG